MVLGSVAALVVITAVGLSVSQTKNPQISDVIPSPFGEVNSPLKGSITEIGRKNNIKVVDVKFDADEVSEPLTVDTIQFVLTPASGISAGAPLASALTPGKRIFGYKYTSRSALIERQKHAEYVAGTPHSFAQLFPGEFFVSPEQRADGVWIQNFELEKGISFLALSQVALSNNSRYIIVNNDVNTVMKVKNLAWCTNGNIEAGETCDDGNGANGDGCSALCSIEPGWSCAGVPSICAPANICGNGMVDGVEECDDGNTIDNDSCNNMCRLVLTPF